MLELCLAALLMPLLTFVLAYPVHAAGWSIEKNETDPFDNTKSTFIAETPGGTGILAIRCLEGDISLMIVSGPTNASTGDTVDLKIVADSKGVQEEEAAVIEATNFATAVQFGDASTLEYLNGVQKISIRYTLAGATSTVSFFGGKSLIDVIAKARKACGIQSSEASKTSPTVGSGNSGQSCQGQFDRMKSSGDLGPHPDQAGFMTWCMSQRVTKP